MLPDNTRDVAHLHQSLQPLARLFLQQANDFLKAKNPALDVRIIHTYRSEAYQNSLWAQGRTKAGNIVTNAKGGQSAHNLDLPNTPTGDAAAFDVGVFLNGKYLTGATKAETAHYISIGAIGKALGLVWGGDFKSIKDYPHYELPNWKALKAKA